MSTFASSNEMPLARYVEVCGIPIIARLQTRSTSKRRNFPSLLSSDLLGDTPELDLSSEQKSILLAIKAMTYLSCLPYIENNIVYPLWHAHPSKHREIRRLEKIVKNLTRSNPLRHKFLGSQKIADSMVRGKGEWARVSFTMLFTLSVIQQYRQLIYPNREVSPFVERGIALLYWRRQTYLDINAAVWHEESKTLGTHSRLNAAAELRDMLLEFEQFLAAQAQQDVQSFIACCGQALGLVKQISMEKHVYATYRRLFISNGFLIPRINWQMRSILSEQTYARYLGAFQ